MASYSASTARTEKPKEKAETGDPDAVKAFQEYKSALHESELRYKLFGV